MPMVYVTGDCHANFRKFSSDNFPEQRSMTKDDYVIVCGDFGIWHDNAEERYWLDWLNDKPFTTLFVDGNHENFDRLYSDEFETVDFHGGKVQKIRDSVLHLMRGHIYELHGSTFFAMGGATSHDISDGILDRSDYATDEDFRMAKYNLCAQQKFMFRVNHESWWKQEVPSGDEFEFAMRNLKEHSFDVDYIITHDCPYYMYHKFCSKPEANDVNMFLQQVCEATKYKHWYCGHHHKEFDFNYGERGTITMLYHSIRGII